MQAPPRLHSVDSQPLFLLNKSGKSCCCCCSLKSAGTILVWTEWFVCGFSLIGSFMMGYNGSFLNSIATMMILVITLTTVMLFRAGCQQMNHSKLTPYLLWKPIQLMVELASLIFFAVVARDKWEYAIAMSLKKESLPSSYGDQFKSYFNAVYGSMLGFMLLYIAVGLFFVYVAYQWRQAILIQDRNTPLISYNIPKMELPMDCPPPYDEVYAPTVLKA